MGRTIDCAHVSHGILEDRSWFDLQSSRPKVCPCENYVSPPSFTNVRLALGFYHLVGQDMNILEPSESMKIPLPNSLSPVVPKTTLKPISQPKRLVIMPINATRAFSVVTTLMKYAPTSRSAFRLAICVSGGVDITTTRGSFKSALILDSPPHNLDVDRSEWIAVEAIGSLEPFLVLRYEGSCNLVALGSRDGSGRIPPNADVDSAGMTR